MREPNPPIRFIGLDIHKDFFVATGVNAGQEVVFGPMKVPNSQLANWTKKRLTRFDSIVLEMTTNTYKFHDVLIERVHSVTVVHPPHVALITRAQVKTDRKASLNLAQLLAAGLLTSVWIPPQEVRDLRALVAQRRKMVTMRTQAKNRLRAVLHRHQFLPPEGLQLFSPEAQEWWLDLPVSVLERTNIACDLDTLACAHRLVKRVEACMAELASQDERMPLLAQIPGVSLIIGTTILASVGEIERFASAKKLVGYAGLGARVHDSGNTRRTGRITKTGRKDLRYAMVEAAQVAARHHPHWKAEFKRLEPRLGRNKTMVAIARKLLVAIWHILSKGEADRYADPRRVANYYYSLAYRLGVANLPQKNVRSFIRSQLDRLEIGSEMEYFDWGGKRVNLPPSILHPE